MRGLGVFAPPVVDKCRPLTPITLSRLLRAFLQLCSSPYEAWAFRAVSIVLFFGAFRPSEVLSASARDFSGRALQLKDISFIGGALIITLRYSKTDQRGAGCRVRLGQAKNGSLCPMRTMRTYLYFCPTVQGSLFCHQDGTPITMFQFRALFYRALELLGLDRTRYGLHSFRIGAASMAAVIGLPARDIQRIGRWRSCAFKYYVRDPDPQQGP